MAFAPRDISVLYLTRDSPNLVEILVKQLGEPVDSYWNGSHTWFSTLYDTELEFRLHPVSGFTMPKGARPEELFELAVEGQVDITHYWEGLEIYTFDETNISVEDLFKHCSDTLEITPEYSGLVDHEIIAQEFERTQGQVSIVKLLIQQMQK